LVAHGFLGWRGDLCALRMIPTGLIQGALVGLFGKAYFGCGLGAVTLLISVGEASAS
jgi:hypothetical protein